MICVCAEDSNSERTVWLLPVSCRHLCGFTLCPKMCEVGCLRPSAGSIETLVPLPSSSSPLDGADAIMQRAVGRVLSALGHPLPTGCLWQWIHWLINSVGWSTDWGAGWAKGQWAGRGPSEVTPAALSHPEACSSLRFLSPGWPRNSTKWSAYFHCLFTALSQTLSVLRFPEPQGLFIALKMCLSWVPHSCLCRKQLATGSLSR